MANRRPDDLQVLLDLSRGAGMVVSCYADTSVVDGFERHWLPQLKTGAARVRKLLGDSPGRLPEFERQLAAIRRALESPDARHAKGMAVFAAEGRDEALALSSAEPYEGRLVVNEEPYLVPLLAADYRNREYLVVLIDSNQGRLFAVAPGEARPLGNVLEAGPRGSTPRGRGTKTPRKSEARDRDERIRRHQRELVRRVEAAWDAHRYQGIVLLGEHEVTEQFRRTLSGKLAVRVVHAAPCAARGPESEIRDRAREMADAAIADQQRGLLEEVDRRLSEGFAVATGPQEVIEAMRNGQVLELVLGPDPGEAASRCPGCRSFFAFETLTCPRCKADCAKTNLWQELLTLAVRHRVAVHFAEDEEGRPVPGGIAAILARDEPQWEGRPGAPKA